MFLLCYQHGHVVATFALRRGRAASLAQPGAGGVAEKGAVRGRHFVETQSAQAGQPPGLAAPELGAQQWRGEQVVQRPRQPLMARRQVLPEIDGQLEGVRSDRAQAAFDGFFQVVAGQPRERRRFQVLDGRDIGQRSMAARRCQQRDVVAAALIAVGAAQVVDAQAGRVAAVPRGQIVACCHHRDAGDLGGPVGQHVDDEDGLQGWGSRIRRLASWVSAPRKIAPIRRDSLTV